ncbi:MAG: hypothetical protein HYX48_01540 [Chlamydiales bacterium]|nr:hypothetical protein [Chlamydiales bacterium]
MATATTPQATQALIAKTDFAAEAANCWQHTTEIGAQVGTWALDGVSYSAVWIQDTAIWLKDGALVFFDFMYDMAVKIYVALAPHFAAFGRAVAEAATAAYVFTADFVRAHPEETLIGLAVLTAAALLAVVITVLCDCCAGAALPPPPPTPREAAIAAGRATAAEPAASLTQRTVDAIIATLPVLADAAAAQARILRALHAGQTEAAKVGATRDAVITAIVDAALTVPAPAPTPREAAIAAGRAAAGAADAGQVQRIADAMVATLPAAAAHDTAEARAGRVLAAGQTETARQGSSLDSILGVMATVAFTALPLPPPPPPARSQARIHLDAVIAAGNVAAGAGQTLAQHGEAIADAMVASLPATVDAGAAQARAQAARQAAATAAAVQNATANDIIIAVAAAVAPASPAQIEFAQKLAAGRAVVALDTVALADFANLAVDAMVGPAPVGQAEAAAHGGRAMAARAVAATAVAVQNATRETVIQAIAGHLVPNHNA